MNKIFTKHETLISILFIVIYLVVNSIFLNKYGMYDWQTMAVNIGLSLLIILFIVIFKLGKYFGLTKFPNPKKFLYFIPLLILMSINLWGGIKIENSFLEITFYIISMIFVGFLEEIIFRGFLFRMMAKDNLKLAIIITSLTFGVGHIINLLTGASFVPTLIQIIYATATGYLFAVILVKGKSLWPCIIPHSVVNALSVFAVDNSFTVIASPLCLTFIPIFYAVYLNKRIN